MFGQAREYQTIKKNPEMVVVVVLLRVWHTDARVSPDSKDFCFYCHLLLHKLHFPFPRAAAETKCVLHLRAQYMGSAVQPVVDPNNSDVSPDRTNVGLHISPESVSLRCTFRARARCAWLAVWLSGCLAV